ncbi:hypothetical protein [Virgibacillus oceani]|uniref:Gram-positive cocci surface proteins LPxTG domain-containing protein n=1 Tax=Virgibacillus oceani TaxID=1479511 RepID=A0A917H6Z3_9BACI|nr:hypothetical protein [Virgibacillus oceani]GGG69511.1 hypothetical protein GCM10011398_11890 [Virgibacillus oceani]
MKKILLFGITFILFMLPFVYPGHSVSGETNSESEIDIGITPSEYLFDIENMKPGDWAPREIVVQNNGLKEFKYVTTVQNEGGSKKLFNELLLEIEDGNGEIYNGKLTDFKGISPRTLAPSSDEKLTFTIRFPEELGNDFQGLSSNFLIIFTAEGNNSGTDEETSGGVVGGDDSFSGGGSKLPVTATNMFTYLLIGAALVVAGGIVLLLYRIRRLDNKRV